MSGERKEESPQTVASDPRRSAWVSANAGSGKTTVLVRRVIRLLLDGVPPGKILCLTYTKAAAAHMANEALKRLSAWVRMDDDELDRAIAEIEPGKPSPDRRGRARRLFAAALETPGGLKVQTIHAFCDRVLHMFPVEAEAPAGFDVLDDLGERDLIETARLQVLLEAGRKPGSPLGIALAHCIEISGDETIEKVIGEAVRARQKFQDFDIERAKAAMRAALGLGHNDTYDTVVREILESEILPESEWESVARTLQSLSKNAAKIGDTLARAATAFGSEKLDCYLLVFFTAEGEPKADTTFGKKDDLARFPAMRDALFAERARLVPLINKVRAAGEIERSSALLTLASAVIERYETMKRRRGVLDFADLVTKTVALLEREKSAWVHYKLDGGIEHILVDEAQDTSPEQWRIIAKLAEEFFAGKGASEWNRTIFAVGDEKQSIFSFQGASPASFSEMRRHFAGKLSAGGGRLEEPRLRMSFRSTKIVLGAVDKIFEPAAAREGLSAFDAKGPLHEAVRQNAPGIVEVWPAIEPVKAGKEEDGWEKPLDEPRESSAPMRLARQIAKAVNDWTHGGLAVGDRKDGEKLRAVTAGDIIVLVQSRGPLFDAILRALKREGVPVAGADRLKLTENIAVMDLMALGDALLLAEDDLSLACVLKSPLFGFSDSDLFTLCHGREDSLAKSLSASENRRYAEAAKLISRWREMASHLRPFDFYSRVLSRDGGRKKMVARLGPEAADALDEFLAAALSYEQAETPSLHGFLSLLRRADAEVKRDFEAEGNAVRVMTVHGVKGLEAPVIVLADTTSLPSTNKEPKMVPVGSGEDAPLIWAASKGESSTALLLAREAARDLRKQEYRRLLYVALTRAADVLVVCGALNKNHKSGPEEGSWYQLVHDAIANDGEHISRHKVKYAGEEVLRWRAQEFPKFEDKPPSVEARRATTPSWLQDHWSKQEAQRARLRPSFAPRDPSRVQSGEGEGGKRRGILIHRLLQSLPGLPETEREAAAQRYLEQAAPELSDNEKSALAREALRVVNSKDCAFLFSSGSSAEPELIARVTGDGREIEITARLDRLVVSKEEIRFGDFKSDAVVPDSAAAIPEHYISQLAGYRQALAAAFPGKRIRAFLIFTAAPRVFEVPEESLESAWARLKTQTSPAFA